MVEVKSLSISPFQGKLPIATRFWFRYPSLKKGDKEGFYPFFTSVASYRAFSSRNQTTLSERVSIMCRW